MDSIPELVTASKGKGAVSVSSGFKLHRHQNLGLPLNLLLQWVWGRSGAFVFLTKSLVIVRESGVCTPKYTFSDIGYCKLVNFRKQKTQKGP